MAQYSGFHTRHEGSLSDQRWRMASWLFIWRWKCPCWAACSGRTAPVAAILTQEAWRMIDFLDTCGAFCSAGIPPQRRDISYDGSYISDAGWFCCALYNAVGSYLGGRVFVRGNLVGFRIARRGDFLQRGAGWGNDRWLEGDRH